MCAFRLWRRAVWYTGTKVLKEHAASILQVNQTEKENCNLQEGKKPTMGDCWIGWLSSWRRN
jgi:hypothetical protein